MSRKCMYHTPFENGYMHIGLKPNCIAPFLSSDVACVGLHAVYASVHVCVSICHVTHGPTRMLNRSVDPRPHPAPTANASLTAAPVCSPVLHCCACVSLCPCVVVLLCRLVLCLLLVL